MSSIRVALNVSSENKKIIEELKDKENVLGFKPLDNRDLWLFAVALGLSSETNNDDKKGSSSWVRTETFKSQEDIAYIRLCLLGKASEEEVENCIDLDSNFRQSELYANKGFEILKEKVELANNDNELLSKMLMNDLERLYTLYKMNK